MPHRPAPPILAVTLALLGLVFSLVLLVAAVGYAAPISAPQPLDACRTSPQFLAAFNATPDMALATDGTAMGLVLRSSTGDYQLPSWDDAGYLGPLAYDRRGDVYVAPTPRLSLADNPLAGAATIWRVDSASGLMHPFTTLSGAANARNPFGILGLAYACDLDTLYAGTVLGSTPSSEHGGVVAIGLADQNQQVVLPNTDVMSVLVLRHGGGYTLYAGLARRPLVLALPLDAHGQPRGPAQPLIDLSQAGATPQERARKLRLVGEQLQIDLVPFTYSLQANATDTPQIRTLTWQWDAVHGVWVR
ncbi:hypothetical protein [Candidatus Oscillochloris fontis]|uniref:hypothetical protein n=1 Tax=Candidatus Oscillochloris fontis TaxID=2496868 RepID=UPI00101CA869|nr:hypothetical protein [Candidatus Oscillochloris fontis]